MNTKDLSKKKNWINIFILQIIMIIYSFANIFAKLASGYDFLSFKFILFYGLEILILGIYALLWQQVLKKFDISIAYMNRSMVLIWSVLWAALFFKETITVNNIIGMMIIFAGTMVVNADE